MSPQKQKNHNSLMPTTSTMILFLIKLLMDGVKTWVKHISFETKKQSMELEHMLSPLKPRKCKQKLYHGL